MSMPFYVSPEQLIKDRAEFARKGISRGRSVVVMSYAAGIALIAHNPSQTLHKVAEIYDRIAFAAVGKYNEFEMLRQAGVRYADLTGYTYDRADVTARGLTNAYAQTLAQVFATAQKPFETEIVVAELGSEPASDQLYRLSYDGSVRDEVAWVVIGGQAEDIEPRLADHAFGKMELSEALVLGAQALFGEEPAQPHHIEAAILNRTSTKRRTFERIPATDIATMLASANKKV